MAAWVAVVVAAVVAATAVAGGGGVAGVNTGHCIGGIDWVGKWVFLLIHDPTV